AGSFTGAVSVATDGGSVTVPLDGSSGTPGNLVITPMSIDFGTVVAGKPKTMSFTLQNTGGLDLTISKSKPPALGAFVARTTLLEGSTIAAGQTITETVEVAANATGPLSDVWVISGNDASGLHDVTFTANGVAALSGLAWVATASASDGADAPQEAID